MTVNLNLVLGVWLFAFAAGASSCGTNPCADLWTAKDCDKVQYCIDNDWSKLTPTRRTDDVCNICLRMVQEARTTLESNDTEEALKQVLEGSCKLLVLKPAVEVCDKIVDQLVPQLVAILATQMDPETVCTVAKLCNNDLLRVLQENSKECTECKKFTAASKETFKSISEKQFEEGLVSLCRDTGSYSDACFSMSMAHSALLYNHTRTALDGAPCEATFLCPSSTETSDTNKFTSDTLAELKRKMCPMCMHVAENIVRQLTRTKSLQDYEENFAKVCTRLNFPTDFCSEAAKNSRAYSILKEDGDSVARFFCRRTVCRERQLEEVPFWPLLPLHLSSMTIGDVEDMILRSLVDFIREDGEKHLRLDMEPEVSGEESSILDCEGCKSMLKKITDSVENEKEKVGEASSRLCDKLPMESQNICQFIVRKHRSAVEEVILQKSSPDKVCIKMNYCSPEKMDEPVKSISYGDPLENPVFLTPVVLSPFLESDCKMCKELSSVLSNYVNASNSYMKQALGVACLMSKNLGKCSNFLESYSPDIARAFAEYVSSEKVCQDVIPSCEPKQPFTAPKTDSWNLCGNCKTWVEGVTSVLLDDKNMEMIKATYAASCDQFPKDLQKNCRDAIGRNSEQNLSSVLAHLSPDEACGSLNYCPRKGSEMTPSPDTSLVEGASGMEKVPCKFCLLALKMLLDQLEDDKTEASIRNALKNICKYFPEETRDTCRNLIDEYSEDIIDMIIADFDPSEICIRLKLCKPNGTLSEDMSSSLQVFDINTNEIRDEEQRLNGISGYMSTEPQAEQALLQRVHSAVQECAMCEALVQVISSHKKMLVKDYDFSGNSSTICRIVPRHKRKQCMSMVVSYGPSIVNLLVDKKMNPNDVCPALTLCDPSMHARVDLPVSVPEPRPSDDSADKECLKGPSFWCANEENARKCGTLLHCREVVWKTEKQLE